MKKYCLSVILTLNCLIVWSQISTIPAFGTNHTLEIATWNIEHFPKNGQSTIDSVTQIIQKLDIDIIAFQEISDTVLFKQMLSNLPDYQYYFKSSWYGGLAYIYKTEVIQINDFFEIYTTSPYWSPFPRSPLVMDMNYLGHNIYVINNHLKCCGDGILDINNSQDEETRRYIAMNLLKEYIDSYLQDKKVLVVGDLNDDIAESEPNNVFINVINDNHNYLFADMDIAQGNNSEWSYPNWPSHLDHLLITNELFLDFQHQDSDIKTIKIDNYLTDGWYEYDNYISDHRPIAIKLKIDNCTDIPFPSINDLFKVYPNPATVSIYLQFKNISVDSRIEIFNVTGQLIEAINLTENQNTLMLQLDGFSKGIHFIKYHSIDIGVLTKKIVIY